MAEYKMHADLLDWPTELQELRMLQAEALGWQPVAPGAYLHLAQPSAEGAATADAAQVVAVIVVVILTLLYWLVVHEFLVLNPETTSLN